MRMENLIYFDVLDTARTKLGEAAEQVTCAEENRFRGQAEIKMALIAGWIPVFPQTSGWDSSALLDYGSEESATGQAFFSLVQSRHIRVYLRDYDSIWEAALAAFASPAYGHLSAWPEFNTENPLEARRPLVETMKKWKDRNTQYSDAVSDDVRIRLNFLRALSSVVKPVTGERELPRLNRLSNLIKAASNAATERDPEAANLLWRCVTEVPYPDNRTAIDTFLDREAEGKGDLVRVVREITNGCFNAVAAHCVRAHPALTLRRPMPVAQEVLLGTIPNSMQSNVFETEIGENEIGEMKALNWDDIEQFLGSLKPGLPFEQRIRRAVGAKLIAHKIVENDPQIVMKCEKKNYRFNTMIWGAANLVSSAGGAPIGGAVGAVAGYKTGGPSGVIRGATAGAAAGSTVGAVLASTVAGGLAGKMTSADKKKEERDQLNARVKQKYLGIIEALEPTRV